jgi:stage IV sporulation protein FB
VRVASIAGIDVRVHASMLLLVWLFVVVAVDEPGGAAGAAVWLVLLFTSVLVHELAHSLVAIRAGVAVKEIELLPIGGLSKMDRIPDRPAAEIAIAAAGPATSFGIGFTALGLAALTGGWSWPPDLYASALVQRLGWLNLVLGSFNLIPALPLDGGRVLRAVLERTVGPTRATHLAARAGHHFAIGLILVGILVNVWLIIIGVFVLLSSSAEDAGAVIHDQLGRLTAADVMIRSPLTVPPTMTVAELTELLSATAQRQFPVVDDAGRYVGLVDADVIAPLELRLSDLMEPVEAVPLAQPLDELAVLDHRTTTAVPVVDHDVVVGLVRFNDVARVAERALRRR